MGTVNLADAKARLSEFVDRVRLATRRIGSLADGEIAAPDDFDRMGQGDNGRQF